MKTYRSINPYTGETLASFDAQSQEQLNDSLGSCHTAAGTLAELSFENRAALFNHVARLLRERADNLANIMALEMGKPLVQGQAEARKCAWVCEYYASNAAEMLAPEPIVENDIDATITYSPLGIILAIMPWNFPLWQVFRCAAPIMMGGNAILLKHAPNVPQCALAIEALFHEAGFPTGALTNCFAETDDVEFIIADRRVAGVTLTGSTKAGRSVAALAGQYLKPCLMELGGSDPYIILDDADLEVAASACVTSRLLNSGQSCIAAKRFLVHESISDEFKHRMIESISSKVVGNPVCTDTDVGPMARVDLADTLRRQVRSSLDLGANLRYESSIPDSSCCVPITVLTDIKPGMPAWDEELFGPVFALRTFTSDDEAVDMANDSHYGLGAGIFSQNPNRVNAISSQLACGNVAINDFVKSDPRYPFGGIKDSGFGRELSYLGARAFMNIKTITKNKI